MLRKWNLALLGLLLVPVMVAAQEQTPPTLVLRAESFDAMVQNFKAVTKAVGKEELGKQVEALIKAQAGPGGLDGIDTTKPIGIYLKMGEDITSVSGVLMVPIKEEKAFLKLLENVDYKATKRPDGIYEIEQTDIPVDVGFRFANGYAYLTALNLEPIAKDANLLTPAQAFPKNIKATLSGVLRVDQIPKAVKDIALSQLEDGLKKLKDEAQRDAETPAQKKFAHQAVDTLGEQVADFLRGATEVSGQLNIDVQTNQISIEITVDGKKNSQLKKTISDLAQNQSLFGGLVKKEADSLQQVHIILPEDLRKAFNEVINEAIDKGLKEEPDDKKRAFAKKFIDALRPTLYAGELDLASATQIHPDGQVSVVAGVKVHQGAKLEQTLKELHQELPPREQGMVKLNAHKAGDVDIHQINIQDTLSAKDKKVLGDGPLYVAIRADAAFISLGKGGLEAIKEAVVAPPTPTAKTLYYELKVGKLLEAFLPGEEEKGFAKKVFATDPGLVRISVEGGQILQIKMNGSIAVLEFGVAASQRVREVKFEVQD